VIARLQIRDDDRRHAAPDAIDEDGRAARLGRDRQRAAIRRRRRSRRRADELNPLPDHLAALNGDRQLPHNVAVLHFDRAVAWIYRQRERRDADGFAVHAHLRPSRR
jgi:hypothetical protein